MGKKALSALIFVSILYFFYLYFLRGRGELVILNSTEVYANSENLKGRRQHENELIETLSPGDSIRFHDVTVEKSYRFFHVEVNDRVGFIVDSASQMEVNEDATSLYWLIY